MSKLQIIIDSVAAAIGAALGFLFGEVNGLFWALIAFIKAADNRTWIGSKYYLDSDS